MAKYIQVDTAIRSSYNGESINKLLHHMEELSKAKNEELIMLGISAILDKLSNPIPYPLTLEQEALRLTLNKKVTQ